MPQSFTAANGALAETKTKPRHILVTGAAGNIGIDAVAKSPPNGYTILYSATASTQNPALFRKLPRLELRMGGSPKASRLLRYRSILRGKTET